eukprot:jgi/Galph1/3355/GphlegSOOS_G2054.1
MQFGDFSPEEWELVITDETSNATPASTVSRKKQSLVDVQPTETRQNSVGNAKKIAPKSRDFQVEHSRKPLEAINSENIVLFTRERLQKLLKLLHDAETVGLEQISTIASSQHFLQEETNQIYRPRGMINRGNTCFMSAILQALFAIDPFRGFFKFVYDTMTAGIRENIISPTTFSRNFPVLQKLCRLTYEFDQSTLETEKLQLNDSTASTQKTVLVKKDQITSESFASLFSRLSKNPISIDEWFHWGDKHNEWPTVSDSQNLNQLINMTEKMELSVSPTPHASSDRMKSFLTLIFGGNQEDSQEFLTHLLNEIHEELLLLRKYLEELISKLSMNGGCPNADEPTNELNTFSSVDNDNSTWEEVTKKGKSAIVRPYQFKFSWVFYLFGGVLRSELHRKGTKASVTREPFLFLGLDIHNPFVRSLHDALRLYMEPESLDGVLSETTQQHVAARKQVTVNRLPKVLILQLKRFAWREGDEHYRKLGKHIDFPMSLSLPGSLLTTPHLYSKQKDRNYELTAVVTHLGKDLIGGHYICDIRWKVEGKERVVWVNCDDSCINSVSEQVVLQRQAYLLFYTKKEEN